MLSPLATSAVTIVRSYSNVAKQLAVCIVGSGPAGFYTAHQVRTEVLLLLLQCVVLLGAHRHRGH
jgi:hypothetical protein